MERLIKISEYPVKPVLKLLLTDKTTKQNIVFATGSYSHLGAHCGEESHIDEDLLLGMDAMLIQPRVLKNASEQADRTKKKAEVMTPKTMVQKMVDHLEEENPGCFDDPDHTFIDLYMKSGMYPAEIAKRLYRSPKMKELFPDGRARLRHIFEKQVYGLAPTEIIYNIAISYILGFDEGLGEISHNFRLADAVPAAREGRLEELLEKLYV